MHRNSNLKTESELTYDCTFSSDAFLGRNRDLVKIGLVHERVIVLEIRYVISFSI